MRNTGIQLAGYMTAIIIIVLVSLFAAAADTGSETFSKKCGLCHDLPDPDAYSKKDWVKNVTRMADRALLTAEEKTAIMALNSGK